MDYQGPLSRDPNHIERKPPNPQPPYYPSRQSTTIQGWPVMPVPLSIDLVYILVTLVVAFTPIVFLALAFLLWKLDGQLVFAAMWGMRVIDASKYVKI